MMAKNLLPMDRVADISVQQITGKKTQKYVSSDIQPLTEKYVGEEDIHISAWDLKRQYKVFKFGLKAETY